MGIAGQGAERSAPLSPRPQADNINTIVKAAGVEVEPYWPGLFAKLAEKKSIEDFILSVGAGASVALCKGGGSLHRATTGQRGRGRGRATERRAWRGADQQWMRARAHSGAAFSFPSGTGSTTDLCLPPAAALRRWRRWRRRRPCRRRRRGPGRCRQGGGEGGGGGGRRECRCRCHSSQPCLEAKRGCERAGGASQHQAGAALFCLQQRRMPDRLPPPTPAAAGHGLLPVRLSTHPQ